MKLRKSDWSITGVVTDTGVNLQEQAEMLVCKINGCDKFRKTLRRHVLQKHLDNVRSLVCNQPTTIGEHWYHRR